MIQALGKPLYSDYVVMLASLAWIGFAGIGVSPGLTKGLSEITKKSPDLERVLLFNSILSSFVICILLFFGYGIVSSFDGSDFSRDLLFCLLLLNVLFCLVDGIRAGYQEQYITNVLNCFSSLALILCLLFVNHLSHPLISVVLIVHALPLLFKLLNGFLIFYKRNYLRLTPNDFDYGRILSLTGFGLSFLLVQISSYIVQQFSLVLVSSRVDANGVIEFSLYMKFIFVFSGFATMLTQSYWPALSKSFALGDLRGFIPTLQKLLFLLFFYCLLVGMLIGMFGFRLVDAWSGAGLDQPHFSSVFFGAFFVTSIISHVWFMVFVSFGKVKVASWVCCVEGLGFLALTSVCLNLGFQDYQFVPISMVIVTSLTSFVVFPLLFYAWFRNVAS
jgi:O-antigen/teichoic acid export membrane protein